MAFSIVGTTHTFAWLEWLFELNSKSLDTVLILLDATFDKMDVDFSNSGQITT
jgi:hypothetical protein